ncbi:MmcQ/YjbR family DNA-binding protein [Salinarimonas sp.]|uniref:MmcQ/YjbR family DNA-binding protein n=1 Tax=Salinarimonas sp. TaxID=2766526 RepID=UPI0032D97BE2
MSGPLRQRVAAICESLPGAEASDPWGGGHEAWKVGDKMFACFGSVTPGVAVKCADVETAQMLIEAGVGARAPYFHRSWLLLPEDVAQDELAHRIAISYDLVRAKLPKRVSAALPAREGA